MARELKLRGYPNPRQEEFFRAKNRHIGYGGSRGGGKSWAMRRKFVLLALRYKGLKLLLLRRTLPELRENHILPLQQELYGIAKYNEDEKSFLLPNGSRIKLGYCDSESDVFQYQGQEYDVVGFEEATSFTEHQKDFILTSNRSTRSDFKPRAYYTANPGGIGHDWFKRLFIDKDYRNKERAEDYLFIPASVYDNKVLMDNNPEYVNTLENLPEELRRAHLHGDWDIFEGQFFREFNRNIHVLPHNTKIEEHWELFRSLDYGLDMTACYWWAVDSQKNCIVYKELYKPNLNLTQAAKAILEMTTTDELKRIRYTVASPDLWNRRQQTGESGVEIMLQAGLQDLVKASNTRIPGWRVLREYLNPFKNEFGDMSARLRFTEACSNLIRTMPKLQFDPKNPEDASGTPHEISHASESIRYGAFS